MITLGRLEVLLGQFGEHCLGGGRLAGRGLAQNRQAELVVEDRAELLGRAEVEFLPCQVVCLALQGDHLLAQFAALDAQQVGVDQRAVALDPRQHRYQRHLDVGQDPGQGRDRLQLLPQGLVQAQGHVGVLRRIGPGLLDGDLVEGQLLGALAGDVLETDGAVAEVLQGQAVHVVASGGGVQHIGLEHGVVGYAPQRDGGAGIGQDIDVVLGMLADLELLRILQQRFQRTKHRVTVQLLGNAHVAVGQRHVGGLALLHGEGHPHHLRLLGVDAGGLGIEGDQLGLLQLLQPGVESGLVEHHVVVDLGLDRRFRLAVLAGLLGLAQEVVQPVLELQLAVQGDQRFALRLAGIQLVDLHVQFDVGLDGRQLIGQERLLAIFLELRRQALGAADR